MNQRVVELETILADKENMRGPAGPAGPQGETGPQGLRFLYPGGASYKY